jgi:hypothetical protein
MVVVEEGLCRMLSWLVTVQRDRDLLLGQPLDSLGNLFPFLYLLDSYRPFYPPTTPKHAQQLMENAETGEKSDKKSPPLQIDPKWYVRHFTLLELLTAETA